jgi:hypothetical protein
MMAAASESGVTAATATGLVAAGASARPSEADFADGDAPGSWGSRDLTGMPVERTAGKPFAGSLSAPGIIAGVSNWDVTPDGADWAGAPGVPVAAGRDAGALPGPRGAVCWTACRAASWAASSASAKPTGARESEPVTGSAATDRSAVEAADKGFSMIVLTDDAERRIAGAPRGAVCAASGADAYPREHNPTPPARGHSVRYDSDVDGD